MKKKIINIFGGGCAGFSFIRRSQEVKDASFKFYLGTENDEKDHYWGCLLYTSPSPRDTA